MNLPFKFATKSFSKKEKLSLNDFIDPSLPSEPKVEKPKFDLTQKNGEYKINAKFLESTDDNVINLVPVLSLDNTKAYLLQGTASVLADEKGVISSPKFKSSILDALLEGVGVDKNSPIYLNKQEYLGNEDVTVYELSNSKYTEDVVKDSFAEVKSIADPTDFSSIQDDSVKDTSEVDMLANVSIEEVSHNLGFSNKPLEELL